VEIPGPPLVHFDLQPSGWGRPSQIGFHLHQPLERLGGRFAPKVPIDLDTHERTDESAAPTHAWVVHRGMHWAETVINCPRGGWSKTADTLRPGDCLQPLSDFPRVRMVRPAEALRVHGLGDLAADDVRRTVASEREKLLRLLLFGQPVVWKIHLAHQPELSKALESDDLLGGDSDYGVLAPTLFLLDVHGALHNALPPCLM